MATYFNNEQSILIELYRLEQYQEILFQLKSSYEYTINIKLDSYKYKKLSNFISLWIINQFNILPNNEIIPDPFFPFNGSEYKQLEKNLINLKFINSANEFTLLMNEWNIKLKFNNACKSITKFIQSSTYIEMKNKIILNVYNESINGINYKKLKLVDQPFKFTHNKPDKFHITESLYNKLNTHLSNNEIYILLLRYHMLDAESHQLAIIPTFYAELQKKYNIDIELFASSINNYFPSFASLFPDIEHKTGSIGYFNHIELNISNTNGFFMVANPPFDENIMLAMSIKFLSWLTLNIPISIILIIPQWGAYGTFESLEILNNSPYIMHKTIINKMDAHFFNHIKNKDVNPCNIYIILLQNESSKQKYNNLSTDLLAIQNLIFN